MNVNAMLPSNERGLRPGWVVVLALTMGTACYPGNEGQYLGTGATEDAAMQIQTILSPSWPYLPTAEFNSRFWLFPPGEPHPTALYRGDVVSWGAGATFTIPITNDLDPSDTGTAQGVVHDNDADGYGDVVEATLTVTDGVHTATMSRTEIPTFDEYRCLYPDFPSTHCNYIGSPVATCTYELVAAPRTYHIVGSVEFKSADGVAELNGHQPMVGYNTPTGGGACAGPPGHIPGSTPGCGTTMTTTVTGDHAGVITLDVASFEIPADATEVSVMNGVCTTLP